MTELRLHVSPGFLLAAAALYYIGGARLLGAVILVDSAHELGHMAAIHLTGAQLRRLRLHGGGAVLECGGLRSRSDELLIVAMGPLAGLAVALVCLAVGTLDGGRIAWLLISGMTSLRAADVILRVSGCLCAAGITALGLRLHSPAAAAAGIYLAALVNFPSMR